MITKNEFDRFTFDAYGPDAVAGMVTGMVGGRSTAPVDPPRGTAVPTARSVREQQLR